MEDFIKNNTEKLAVFKKNFAKNTISDFLTKLCKRGDISKMESELEKFILNSRDVPDYEKRKEFIFIFIKDFKELQDKGTTLKFPIFEKPEIKSDLGSLLNPVVAQKIDLGDKKPIEAPIKKAQKNENFKISKKFRPEKLENPLPQIYSTEVMDYRKKYEFLEHHYKHKIEPTTKVCFCMGTKHPIVANCLNCGRIHCLQEGEDKCIECKTGLLSKNEFLKKCIDDPNLKKAHDHKEKLLKFQKEFYSKMSIIDDYTDWYEISNNTWIPHDMRNLAKEKDEELEKLKDDPDYTISINFKTNEITKVYDVIDEAKVKQEISDFFVNSIRGQKENNKGMHAGKNNKSKNVIPEESITCSAFSDKAAEDYKNFLKEKGLGIAKK